MKAVVDRIEGNIVVCELEDETILNIDISDFLEKPNENDIIECIDEKWKILKDDTINRKKYIEHITNNMWKN